MKLVKPVSITTDAILTGSSIAEPDPSTGEVEWVAGTYTPGQQVIKTSTHKIYQCVTETTDDPEVGAAADVPTWIVVSSTNKFKAFDNVVTTSSTTSTGEMWFEITPNSIFNSVAGLGCFGVTSVNITMTDPVEGEVYNETIPMIDESEIVNWYEYTWAGFTQNTNFAKLDLPPYVSATIKVTLTGGGNLGCGVITVGKAVDLGITDRGTSAQLLDFSTYKEDDFGNLSITKRTPAILINFVVSVESVGALDYVYNQLKSVVGEPALYVGEEDNPKNITTAYGLHQDVELTKQTQTLNTYTLKVRGLV